MKTFNYLRDFSLNYGFIFDNVEATVNFEKAFTTFNSVKERFTEACGKRGIAKEKAVVSH